MKPALFDDLIALDARLASHGFPRFSKWWRRALRSFLTTGKRRLVLRVGRRGGKSLTLAKFVVAVAMHASLPLPPGERAIIAWLSIDLREAGARLVSLRAMFDALGIAYTARGDEIELHDRPVTIRCYPASYRAVVGFSSPLVICDEVSRWRDSETGSNPAAAVVDSISPTLATLDGFLVLASAPWSDADYHATEFEKGNTPEQHTAHAPTWEANPTLSRDALRKLAGDERSFLRDYAAIPQGEVSSPFEPGEVDALVTTKEPARRFVKGVRYGMTLDVGLRRDRTGAIIFHRELVDGPFGPVDVIVC